MGLFMQHARKRNLVRAENCVECLLREFLDSAYTAFKSRTYGRVVNLFETTDCLNAGKAIRWGSRLFGATFSASPISLPYVFCTDRFSADLVLFDSSLI